MSKNESFRKSLFGYNENDVNYFVENLVNEYQRKIIEKDNILTEITEKYNALINELEAHRAKSVEIETIKAQISQTVIEASQRMEVMIEDAKQKSDNILGDAQSQSAQLIGEANTYRDETIAKVDSYRDETISKADEYERLTKESADTIAEKTLHQIKEDYDMAMEEAKLKAENIIAEAYSFAEKEKSDIEREIEQNREVLVGLKQAIKGLKDDARSAMELFEHKLLNSMEKVGAHAQENDQ